MGLRLCHGEGRRHAHPVDLNRPATMRPQRGPARCTRRGRNKLRQPLPPSAADKGKERGCTERTPTLTALPHAGGTATTPSPRVAVPPARSFSREIRARHP